MTYTYNEIVRRLNAVVSILKDRFPNLTTTEVNDLAGKILTELESKE